MTKMKEALNTLMAGFEALQAAIDEAESKDSQAEKAEPEAESGQEKNVILAQSLSIGTMIIDGERYYTVSLESGETPVKLVHPLTADGACSVAQSMFSLVDNQKEE